MIENTNSTTPATILVVDDMAICREPIAEILRSRGFEVVCVSSGQEALRTLDSMPIDLMLLDVMMPGMDGLSVLSVLRNQRKHNDLPVILLTDLAEKRAVQKAAVLGVQSYLLKSHFTMDDLISRVERFIKAPQPGDAGPISRPVQPAATPTQSTTPAAATAKPGNASTGGATTHPAADTPRPKARRSSDPVAPPSIPKRKKDEVLAEIRRTFELRPFPPVLHYVISQTNSANASIHEVANTLRQDQALAVRIMKVANSSSYTRGKRTQNLVDAAGRLGMSGIRNAVVTTVAMDYFANAAETGLVPQRFWEHSLGAAFLGQALAESMNREDGEEIFLAGLLHDIGRFVLGTAFPKDYQCVLSMAESTGMRLSAAEREIFGTDHAEVTHDLLQHLSLPPMVVTAASLHQKNAQQIVEAEKEPRAALLVALADRLAHTLMLGDSGDSTIVAFDEFAQALNLEVTAVAGVARDTVTKIRDMEMFYACQGESELLLPLSKELAQSVDRRLQVAILTSTWPNDSLSLFFEQLGWSDNKSPDVAVVAVTGQDDLDVQMRKVAALDRECESPLPLLIVKNGEFEIAPPDHRAVEIAQFPIPSAQLVELVSTQADAEARNPAAATV